MLINKQWGIWAGGSLTQDMPPELREKLQSQGYHLLGERGAFKACQWQRKSLISGKTCYKQRFYGIESHRCLQMTPTVDKCTQQCEFCWRVTPDDLGVEWNQVDVDAEEVLSPEELLEETLMANLRSLGGYNPEAGADVPEKRYLEARDPKHIAISLAGEPTLYPFLSDFVQAIRKRDMTSFLVTNGTQPDTLRSLTLPTQLYITLAAPSERLYKKLCRPAIADGWSRIQESQKLLSTLSCRTVNRLTMVEGYNMTDVHSYADMILTGEPDFVEVKGYMFIGSSRNRLRAANSPPHRSIRAFSDKLEALTGYHLVDEQIESRVVLLSRNFDYDRINGV
ncbi:4-demethylwyosine synthase TYW1 [Candidatus Thorarchaeota archaeon]|jgi:tRNA wybutosine-synthesizing protein 1|nr:MAG: 4-demethylwyosine synthase TYW1 [Candidatus Thorarchaeota archaeon]